MYFGVDIGGTAIKIGSFSDEIKLLGSWSVATDISDGGSRIIPSIAGQIRDYLERKQIRPEQVKGIGMGVPGPVDRHGNVRACVNLNWRDFNPAKEMEKEFPGIPAAAGNDANMAALGEFHQGAAGDAHSMMLITVGTGIGGGIVQDGRIIAGAHGLAGEIGHIAMDRHAKERCNCGNLGCIDHVSSASGIVRVMKELLEVHDTDSVLRGGKEVTAKAVCDAAAAGDPLAVSCIDICMEPLGRGMAVFSHAFDPEVYVIGGGVSRAGDVILEPLRRHYQENLFLTDKGADIRQAVLGNDAGMIGAALLSAED